MWWEQDEERRSIGKGTKEGAFGQGHPEVEAKEHSGLVCKEVGIVDKSSLCRIEGRN